MKNILLFFIKIYKKIPGFWHGYCKFQPTCSDYALIAIREHGALKGSFLTIKRILRCNPFSKGGYDPVPQRGSKSKKIKL